MTINPGDRITMTNGLRKGMTGVVLSLDGIGEIGVRVWLVRFGHRDCVAREDWMRKEEVKA